MFFSNDTYIAGWEVEHMLKTMTFKIAVAQHVKRNQSFATVHGIENPESNRLPRSGKCVENCEPKKVVLML